MLFFSIAWLHIATALPLMSFPQPLVSCLFTTFPLLLSSRLRLSKPRRCMSYLCNSFACPVIARPVIAHPVLGNLCFSAADLISTIQLLRQSNLIMSFALLCKSLTIPFYSIAIPGSTAACRFISGLCLSDAIPLNTIPLHRNSSPFISKANLFDTHPCFSIALWHCSIQCRCLAPRRKSVLLLSSAIHFISLASATP